MSAICRENKRIAGSVSAKWAVRSVIGTIGFTDPVDSGSGHQFFYFDGQPVYRDRLYGVVPLEDLDVLVAAA